VELAKGLAGLIFALSTLSFCSCGLLFQGTTEEINVASEPPGATVTLNDGGTKVTPFSITAPRQQDLQFHFNKPGYQSADVADNSKIEPGYMAADLFPFLLPWSIDAASGAGYEHQQTTVTAHLDPAAGAEDDSPVKAVAPVAPAVPEPNTESKGGQ